MTSTSSTYPTFKSEDGRSRYLAAYDAVLKEWPTLYEELDIQTSLGTTHVIASGPKDAPALVLLPSFAGAAVVWRLNIDGLAQHFRTYAVDVMGQPGKSAANRRIRGRQDYAAWFRELLDGLGVERASIVGCSFGGFLALSQAALTPERVDKVVLIGPAGSFVGLSWKLAVSMWTAPARRFIRRLLGDKRAPDIANLVRRVPKDEFWRTLMSVTMTEVAKVSVTNAPVFSSRELRRVRAPVLLLIGEYEQLYQPEATLKLAMERMPGLTGAVVPDADHVAAMAQPEDVNARMVSFLLEAA